jgi:hypothetical protein
MASWNPPERVKSVLRDRYISTFQSRASWLLRAEAERQLREEETLYRRLDELGLLSQQQRERWPLQSVEQRAAELAASQPSI